MAKIRRESKISGALLNRHFENSFKNLPISDDPLQADGPEISETNPKETLQNPRKSITNKFSDNIDSKVSYFNLIREWISHQTLWDLITIISPLLKQLSEYHLSEDANFTDETRNESLMEASGNTLAMQDDSAIQVPKPIRVKTPFINGIFPFQSSSKAISTVFTHLLKDFKASIPVTLVSVPFAIAYASLAQVSPVNALVSTSIPSIVYSLIGTSPHICIGPESLVSIMVGMGVRDELAFTGQSGSTGVQIACSLGLLCGVIGLGMAFFQNGFLADVLAGYLLLGFVTGVANLIMVRQIPDLFGISSKFTTNDQKVFLESQSAINQLIGYIERMPSVSANTIYLSLVGFAFLLLARVFNRTLQKRYPNLIILPEVLLLFVLSIGLSASLDLEKKYGISVLGPFQQSMPPPRLPKMSWDFFARNFSLACTITLFGFFETVTLVREYGMKNRYFPSSDRILFSLGTVNVIGSCFGGYPTFACPSRSPTQSSSGARSLLVGIFSGILIIIITSTFATVFQYLPRSVLAVLVTDAAFRRIPFDEIKFTLKKRNFQEIAKFFVAYLLTISLNPSLGVIFCLILSALVIIRRSTVIHVSVLGEIEVKDERNVNEGEEDGAIIRYVDISEHPEAFVIAQVVPLSVKGSLEYFNATRIARRVEMLTDAVSKLSELEQSDPTTVNSAIRNSSLWIARECRANDVIVIIDLSAVDNLDSSAAWQLKKLYEKSSDRILFCGLHPTHLHMLDFVKSEDIFSTMVEALEYVKVLLYSNSDTISTSAAGHNDISIEFSFSSNSRWMPNRPISPGQFTGEENQYSVRSVRSLRSLHTEWTDHIQAYQNQHSLRAGEMQFSTRSSKRDSRPIHVRNLFPNAAPNSNAQEGMDSFQSAVKGKDNDGRDPPRVVLVIPNQCQSDTNANVESNALNNSPQ